MRRVAVTGIGLVTALGTGTDETWQALVAGKSAVDHLRGFDAASLDSRLGAEIAGFDPTPYVKQRRALRNMTRNDQLAVAGAALAVRDAGLELGEDGPLDPDRLGLFIGGNKEISEPSKVLDAVLLARNDDGTADLRRMGTEGAAQFYPLFYVEGLQAAALFYISQAHGLRGTNTYFAGTGDAGATAVGRAFRAVRRGEATVAVAGGFDDPTSWWSMTKLDPLGVLTASNDLGAGAFRPFDRGHDGAVTGEGAAFVVLEDLDAARSRGATVYAEVTGFGSGFDAGAVGMPARDGRGLAHAIRAALDEAGVDPADVDYVAADGAATATGDAGEAAALRAALGPAAGTIAASSVKPATGNLVAGAGPLNVAVAALTCHHATVPPTLNLTDVDPACEGIDWVPREARNLPVGHALALSRGLEGQNVALALRAAP
ncbi:beta-ketoacyl-[acyl-carrier-protein] synthase family protein [Jiangella alkaliphila]|uniref:3-oxoacyl-[acyl-carrier-protein] synthase II n=1 Tax=Jiangella alkaliphila TaxID=419479 RepID=A0A1H2I7D9_9ACTN|nr:beta-ketoacyl synthase N-terminal-like domain-containing protein [Jiangella alkaliphila]SDU39758.1 3-oxoacyl-[acyl-carrier-protein] synthase II [Jiangella alkaliphila]